MVIKSKLLFWLLLPNIIITISVSAAWFFTNQKTIRQNINNQIAISDVQLREEAPASLEGEKSSADNFQSEANISGFFASPVYLRNFLILMGIIGGTSAVVMINISQRISNSLKIITEGTKKIASGDFGYPISTDTFESEVRVLGESFNLMMNKLREAEDKNRELFLQVKRGRDEWQETFDSIKDVITIIDKDFRIIRANKAFFKEYNIDKTRLKEKKCFEVFYGVDAPSENCPLMQCFENLKTVYEEMVDTEMDEIFLVTVFPLFDEEGEIYGAVHQKKDITFQKKLLKELMKKANKLDEANRELERLTRIVSELR
ncbi:MAG: PAS domain-containing protein [Candidatus Scalindua sp.]|nr:PAS domain-containing protein [Candidatus Scalindua sp.]